MVVLFLCIRKFDAKVQQKNDIRKYIEKKSTRRHKMPGKWTEKPCGHGDNDVAKMQNEKAHIKVRLDAIERAGE